MLKKCSRNGFGLLPNCIVKKKKKLYCNLWFVLQEEGWLHERVSQYKNCIVTWAAGGLGKKKKLYCDIAWWVENCITREGLLASVLQ